MNLLHQEHKTDKEANTRNSTM